MAQPSRTLVLTLTAVTDKFKKGLGDAEKSLGGFSTKLGSFAKKAGAAFAAIGVAAGALAVKIGKDAIGAASDLAEEISKSEVLFGDSAAAIQEWSETAATAFGQSRQQALAAAGNFAIFGKSAGLTGDDLNDFSTGFTELASDLASFNNTTPEDAIQALGAALRGESEPIRRYGILLDDATLRQTALELGIIETTKNALTPQQRVLAAQEAILRQVGDAAGDFARTSDGLANQQRILAANLEDVKSTIGEALLPVATEFSGWLVANIPRIQEIAREFGEKLGPAVKTAGDFIKNDLLPFARDLWPHIRDLAIWVKDAVAAVVEFVRDEIAPRFKTLLEQIEEPATNAWNAIKELGTAIAGATRSIKDANPEGSMLLDWLFKLEAIKWDYLLTRLETMSRFLTGIANAIKRIADFAGGNVLDLGSFGAPAGGGSGDLGFVPGSILPDARSSSMPGQRQTGNVIVNINGPVDSEGAAREVRRVLVDSARRTGYGQLATVV